MKLRNTLFALLLLLPGFAFAQNPTPVGTAVSDFTDPSNGVTVSITIGAACDAVVVFNGGFSNETVNSVTLDGSAMEEIIQGANGTNQFGGLYYMDSADVNWPGTGTFNIVSDWTGGDQHHLLGTCFQDVDTTTAGYRTAVEASGSADDPSITLTGMTTGTDTMIFAGAFYENESAAPTTGALINENDNAGSASSSIFTYDNAPSGASDSIGITTDASVAHWFGAVALIGTSAGSGTSDVHTMQDPAKTVGPHKSQTLGGHLEVSNP